MVSLEKHRQNLRLLFLHPRPGAARSDHLRDDLAAGALNLHAEFRKAVVTFPDCILGWKMRQIRPCRNSISGDNGIMTTTVEAIYEHGKLLLPAPLSLPEKSHVRVTI